MVFYDNRKKIYALPPWKIFLGHLEKNIVQRNVAEKKFLQAVGGWKKIRAQKNCPTPPQISNGPSLRYSSKSSNVLNTVFLKQNISCFEIRWPRPIWSVNVFFMHSASAVDIYRAQRKHINYSIWPMRISRHDLRRRYSNSLVIDAGSQFTLRACSQASRGDGK